MLFVMNKAKYDGLPDDLKKVIDDNSGAALIARSRPQVGRVGQDRPCRGTQAQHADPRHRRRRSRRLEEGGRADQSEWIEERDKAGDNGAELSRPRRTWSRSTPSE